MKKAYRFILPLSAMLMLSACASLSTENANPPASAAIPAPKWQGPWPEVAATYRTTLRSVSHKKADAHKAGDGAHNDISSHADDHETHDAEHNAQRTWRIWRKTNVLVRENLDAHTADHWFQDGNTLIQKTFYHDDQRGVEFQQADLQIMQKQPRWQTLSLMFDPALLSKLNLTNEGWRDGIPFQRYEGELDASHWLLEVRTDLMVPVRVEHKTTQQEETIELVAAYPLTQAPWQATATQNYNVIDYADLGDMEYDPFVKKVEAQLGGVHHH